MATPKSKKEQLPQTPNAVAQYYYCLGYRAGRIAFANTLGGFMESRPSRETVIEYLVDIAFTEAPE